jgi:hypothetical protein
MHDEDSVGQSMLLFLVEEPLVELGTSLNKDMVILSALQDYWICT